jgi:hypothetical protein
VSQIKDLHLRDCANLRAGANIAGAHRNVRAAKKFAVLGVDAVSVADN